MTGPVQGSMKMGAHVMLVFNSNPLSYVVSLPPKGQSCDSGTPVLCFLHGYGEAAPMDISAAATLHGPLRQASSQKATDCFIVAAPQLPAKEDDWHKYANAVRGIVIDVQNNYGGNRKQTYLTGFSYGGNGVFDIALSTPGFWAALWPVDPTKVPSASPKVPIWFSMGERSRGSKDLFIERLHLAPATDDEGADYVYLDTNEDHVRTAITAYETDKIYKWLQLKHL